MRNSKRPLQHEGERFGEAKRRGSEQRGRVHSRDGGRVKQRGNGERRNPRLEIPVPSEGVLG